MHNPKISIITVVLNGEKTIERTIQSVLTQNYNNLEYIIIDGGSTDNTIEIINKYKERITYFISEPDKGIYDAMNKGIKQASGDIIGIINSDDWYEAGAFCKVCEVFQSSDADIVYGKLKKIYEDGRKEESRENLLKNMCFGMAVPHPTVFIKRKIYMNYGMFSLDYKIASDYELLLHFYLKGLKFNKINRILANFSMNGISNKKNNLCTHETREISDKYLSLKVLEQVLYGYKIQHKDSVLVYGAGYWGNWLIDKLIKMDIKNILCVDKDEEKQGKEIRGVKIEGINVLKEFKGKVLVAIYNTENLCDWLVKQGISINSIIEIRQIIDNYNEIMEEIIENKY